MKKFLKKILLVILLFILLLGCFFFVGKSKPAEKINWGIVFSQKHSELLGLDWKGNYLAILDDLKAKKLKLVAYWDLIEKKEGVYSFEDLDWQINEAEKRNAKVLLVIGRRLPRWPECHIPDWAENSAESTQQQKVLALIEQIILRYKDNPTIEFWQVENEPFFPFGECPPLDKKFLKKEVDLVKSLDTRATAKGEDERSSSTNQRPVVVSESGEFPLWFNAAKFGDIVGHTLYRKVWVQELKIYFTYPFPPIFYGRKAWLINKLFHKKVICVELQAEPWGPTLLYDLPLEEQKKTMDIEQFKKNIEFAKNTGIDTFYLWGAEWWYWLKEKQNDSRIWDEARDLFIYRAFTK
jgi:hypothetical protein